VPLKDSTKAKDQLYRLWQRRRNSGIGQRRILAIVKKSDPRRFKTPILLLPLLKKESSCRKLLGKGKNRKQREAEEKERERKEAADIEGRNCFEFNTDRRRR